MKYAITRAPKKILSSKTYYFALFGDNFSKLINFKIISESKNMTIVHMSLQRRIKEIFTLADLCAVDFIIDKKQYTCCGKVNTEKDGHHMISYIVDECHET